MSLSLLLQAGIHHAAAAPPASADQTQLLLLILCGFVALYFILNKQQQQAQPAQHALAPLAAAAAPSAEVRALQDSVRLLLEAQQRQAMQPQHMQPPQPWADYQQQAPQQQQQRRSSHMQQAAPQQRQVPIVFDSSRGAGNDSPADSASDRAPSFSVAAGSSGSGVPFELLQDLKLLQDSVKNLERRNRELNRQLTLTEVSNVVDVEKKYRLPIPVVESSGSAKIEQLDLSASEIETIRAIFNMFAHTHTRPTTRTFDTEHAGWISTKELRALHKQLGEPLTEDEASAAVSELDQEGTGTVTFNKFLIWWYHQHASGSKKGSAYTQRFKLLHAKLSTSEFDVAKVITQDSGEVYTLEYRLSFYYKSNNNQLKPISPWHDIPLNRLGSGEQGQLFNFVCEIPKWTRAKFECATGELYNPIKQDTQHGKLRYYKHGDMMFNYGFFPQTWEDPEVIPADTKCPGDNDPIDCVEIGATQLRVGSISAVKILGLLGLIDDGETDWKVIAINISDPMAHLLNDVDDVEYHLPGAIKAIREYFRDYKSFSGKINTYALRAQAMPRHYALKVLEETHQHWASLHLVKKRDTIGESTAQAETRLMSVATNAAAAAATELPQSAQALFAAANASPRLAATHAHAAAGQAVPHASSVLSPRAPNTNKVVEPISNLTGVEQPLDKLSKGK